jgi:hypothetical protein
MEEIDAITVSMPLTRSFGGSTCHVTRRRMQA